MFTVVIANLKMAILMVRLLLHIVLGLTVTAALCPDGWRSYQMSCYNFVQNKVNWIEANSYCRLFGAYLVEMTSRDEINFVTKELADKRPSLGSWIGLSDMMNEGKWIWTSEQLIVSETNWGMYQPDNRKEEDCVESDLDSRWHDGDCSLLRYFVCEMSDADPIIG